MPRPPWDTQTRVVLITHYREDRRTTNTGRLATQCLANAEVVVRGHRDAAPEAHAPLALPAGYQPLLLYPAADAHVLAPRRPDAPPVVLIVPDGNWRQASKVRHRQPGLAEVPCVTLPPGPPTAYHLRHEPKAGGLATMEAIARALGVLEGPAGPAVQAGLERVFAAMVAHTLRTRGR